MRWRNYQIYLITLLGAFLRLFRINVLTTFLGEQGRDLLVAKDILLGKFTLLGPATSISDIHFGPFYHYFNALFLLVFKMDPIGPAVGFALLSILSIFFIYKIASNFNEKKAGLISASLFAVSPFFVEHGKTMFNSDFLISFSVFSFWALSVFLSSKKGWFLILCGLFAGIALQANFLSLGFSLGILFILCWKKVPILQISYYIVGVFVAIFPYIAFELRHDFFNTRAFVDLLNSGNAISFSISQIFYRLFYSIYEGVYYSLAVKEVWLAVLLTALLGIMFLRILTGREKSYFLKIIFLLVMWRCFIVAIYPGEILEHYLGATYIFILYFFGMLFSKSKHFFVSLLVFLLFFNLFSVDIFRDHGYNMPDGWNMVEVKKVSAIIAKDADDSKFNIATILTGDTRAYHYRYLINLFGKNPLGVENYPEADILYVVAKGNGDFVLTYPVWEISSFLPARIDKQWPVTNEVSVFKLKKI